MFAAAHLNSFGAICLNFVEHLEGHIQLLQQRITAKLRFATHATSTNKQALQRADT